MEGKCLHTIHNLNNELNERTFKKCNELLEAKQTRSEMDKNKAKYIDQLTEQSKALASKLKSQHLTDGKIEEELM